MKSKNPKIKIFIIISAVIAVWALALADLIIPIKNMYGEGFYTPIANASIGKVYYTTCALFTFPFIALGLKKIVMGTNLKWLTPLIFFFTGTITISIHTAYYYYYHVARRLEGNPILKDILKDFDKLKDILGTIYFIGLGFISLVLFIAVLMRKTIYPRYFAIFNPVVGVILLNLAYFINNSLGDILTPFLIPGTVLAIMVTIYLPYYFKKDDNILECDRRF
ncbi:MAG: hypothetical protein Q4P31_05675 [Andreesenia angusta]|nr:hypothetical protein [Andreesenia angusta]